MTIQKRVKALMQTQNLRVSIPNVETFSLANLKGVETIELDVPSNLRLGHQIEKVVSALIQASSNFELIAENVQIIADKITIGELDFIIKDQANQQLLHLELVYKFYVYDPAVSDVELKRWIGPNRKDSLLEKMEKLRTKQFPLLYRNQTQQVLKDINIEAVKQTHCFMAHLFVPYVLYGQEFSHINNQAIVGYWFHYAELDQQLSVNELYYLPTKKEWGLNPADHQNWENFEEFKPKIVEEIGQKRSPLCWVKSKTGLKQCFVVWW